MGQYTRQVDIVWDYSFEEGQACKYPQTVWLYVSVTDSMHRIEIYNPDYTIRQKSYRVDLFEMEEIKSIKIMAGYPNDGECTELGPNRSCFTDGHNPLAYDENDYCEWTHTDLSICGFNNFYGKVNISPTIGTSIRYSEESEEKASYCPDEKITFKVPCNMEGGNNYRWYYSKDVNGWWQFIKNTNSETFTVGKNQDFMPDFGTVTYLKVQTYSNGSFQSTPSPSFTFYSRPKAKGTRTAPPACAGDNTGKIIIPEIEGSTGKYEVGLDYLKVKEAGNCAGGITYEKNGKQYCRYEKYNITVDPDHADPLLDSEGNIVLDYTKRDNNDQPIALNSGYWLMYLENAGTDASCAFDTLVFIEDKEKVKVTVLEGAAQYVPCAGDTKNIAIAVEGGAGGYSYQWSNGSTAKNLSGATASLEGTAYRVTVTDQNGCTATANTTLYEPGPLIIGAVDKKTYDENEWYHVSCPEEMNGTITFPVSGGTLPYDLTLKSAEKEKTITIDDEDQAAFFDELSADQYLVIVTDANGCTTETSTQLIPPDSVKLDYYEITSPACAGDNTAILYLKGAQGIPIADNQYTYTIQHLDVPSNLPFPFVAEQTMTADTAIFDDLIAGDYLIKIEDQYGCKSKDTVLTIDPPDSLKVTLWTTRVTCFEGEDGTAKAVIQGGTPPYTILWMNEAERVEETQTLANTGDTAIFANRPGGTYYYHVTDSKGCYWRYYPQLFEIPSPAAPLALYYEEEHLQHPRCHDTEDGSVILQARGGWPLMPYQFGMNKEALDYNQNFYDQLAPGTYWFYAADAMGCLDSLEVMIQEPEELTADITAITKVSCQGGNNGSFQVTAHGGTTPYQFSIDGGNTWTDQTTFSHLSSGTYLLTVTDASQVCSIQLEVTVTEPPALEITPDGIHHTSCGYANGSAAVLVEGGTLPYTHTWYDSYDQLIGDTPLLSGLSAGIYRYEVTDAKGCSANREIIISNIDGPQVGTEDIEAVSCFGEKDGSAQINIIQATNPVHILWDDGQSSLKATQLPAGTHRVTITDANGCQAVQEVVIPTPEPLKIQVIEIRAPLCFEACSGILSIAAKGGVAPYTYSWAHGASTNRIENLCAATYEVVVTDANGCIVTQPFTLEDPLPLVVDLEDSAIICNGQTYTLDAGYPGSTYHWSSSNGFESTAQTVSLYEPGVYTLEVTNENGCSDFDTFELITSDNLLSADFLMSSEGVVGDTIVVISISWPIPDTVRWSVDKNITQHESQEHYQALIFPEEGTYTVSLEARLADCQDQISKQITIYHPADTTENARTNINQADIRDLKILPNPNSGKFLAKVVLLRKETIQARLLDIHGNDVMKIITLPGQKQYELSLNLPALQKGVYFLVVTTKNDSKIVRVLIK